VLHQLENLLIQLKIKYAIIDGNKVIELSKDESIQIARQKLLECIIIKESDIYKIKSISRFVGGMEEKIKAIICIQSFWRMYCSRNRYLQLKPNKKAISIILNAFRRYKCKTKIKREILYNEQCIMVNTLIRVNGTNCKMNLKGDGVASSTARE
jgi:hypothetical protein